LQYSGKELGNSYLEECVDNRLFDLFKLIGDKYLSTGAILKTVDFSRILQYFVVDVITDIAFREPFGLLEADDDIHGYISTQEELLPVFEWLSALPSIAKFLKTPWIAPYVLPKPTDKTGIGYMFGYVSFPHLLSHGAHICKVLPKRTWRSDSGLTK
jgi:hypothetical protein